MTVLDRAARSFRDDLARLAGAQKPGAGVPAYLRWVNRRAGRVVAAAAARAGLTPDAVTLISAGLSAGGLVLIALLPPSWPSGVLAAALLALGFAFDSADGQLARLTGASGPAGEWLDHVVDAVRTPVVHLVVAAALLVHRPDLLWAAVVAACFAVLSVGQFMSQILAEQLAARAGDAPAASPVASPVGGSRTGGSQTADPVEAPPAARSRQVGKSLLLLPTDTGALCWVFALWGAPTAFCAAYAVLFAMNLVHVVASMRRKRARLVAIGRAAAPGPDSRGPS